MKNEDNRKINISDLKISKSRKEGFSNDEYSFMIPDNFCIKIGADDRDFIAYLDNKCDDWYTSNVVIYSSDVTPYQELELYSINGFLLAYDCSYWLVIYNDFKALFGGSEYHKVELESGLARVVCAHTEYFTSLYFITCINSGYKQIHIQFNDVLGSLDEMLKIAVEIMNGFKVEKEIVVVNDINDERYFNGKFSVDDWINNLDKVGKDLQINLGVRAKVEVLKKTKLLMEEKKYNDDFSKIIKQLCDNYVNGFDESLKKIETYFDKINGKIDKKKHDFLYRKVKDFAEKYKKYSLTTDDGLIKIESKYVSDFYKKVGISNDSEDNILGEVSKWEDEVLEIENIMNSRLDEVTNKFNEDKNKEVIKLEKKKDTEIEKLEKKCINLKTNIEDNNDQIEKLSFINFMKKNELKLLNEKMLKEIDDIKKKIDKVSSDFNAEVNKINSDNSKLEKLLESEKDKFIFPYNPDVVMNAYEKDRISVPDKEYYEKQEVKKLILNCLNNSFNPLSVLKMKEMNSDLEPYSNLFMFSALNELVRNNKISKTMISGTAYFEISNKSKFNILETISLKDKGINTSFSKDRELVFKQIKKLVDSELKVSFDKLVEEVCSKEISMVRLLQVLKSLVDERILFKECVDNTIIYVLGGRNE